MVVIVLLVCCGNSSVLLDFGFSYWIFVLIESVLTDLRTPIHIHICFSLLVQSLIFFLFVSFFLISFLFLSFIFLLL